MPAEFAYVNYFSYLCIAFPLMECTRLMKFAVRWTLAFIIFTLALICTSCNVTRTITTTSTAYQRGDTSVVIQTKTTETYDGTLKYNK